MSPSWQALDDPVASWAGGWILELCSWDDFGVWMDEETWCDGKGSWSNVTDPTASWSEV